MRLSLLILVTGIAYVPNLFSSSGTGLEEALAAPKKQLVSIFDEQGVTEFLQTRNPNFAKVTGASLSQCPLGEGCDPEKLKEYRASVTALQQAQAYVRDEYKALEQLKSEKADIISSIDKAGCTSGENGFEACQKTVETAKAAVEEFVERQEDTFEKNNATVALYRGNFTGDDEQIRIAKAKLAEQRKLEHEGSIQKLNENFNSIKNEKEQKAAVSEIVDALGNASDDFKGIKGELSAKDQEEAKAFLEYGGIPACKKKPNSALCKKASQELWAANTRGPTVPNQAVLSHEKCNFWDKLNIVEQPIRGFIGQLAGGIGYFVAEAKGYDNSYAMILAGLSGKNSGLSQRYDRILAGGNPDGIDIGGLKTTPMFAGVSGTPGSGMTIGAGSNVYPALSPFPGANGRSELQNAQSTAAAQTALASGATGSAIQQSAMLQTPGLNNLMNSTGGGSRIDTSAANSVYANFGNQYNKMGQDAKAFNSQYDPAAGTYTASNAMLASLTAGGSSGNAGGYAAIANKAVSTVKAGGSTSNKTRDTSDEVDKILASGVKTPTPVLSVLGTPTTTTDIRTEISKQDAQQKSFLALAASKDAEILDNSIAMNWGSKAQRTAAMKAIVKARAEQNMLRNIIAANQGYNNAYRMIVTPYLYGALDFSPESIMDAFFDIGSMYASNSDTLPKSSKKTLSLTKMKTSYSIQYKYKTGWENVLLDYARKMIVKSKEAKIQLEDVKKQVRAELKKDLPSISKKQIPRSDAILRQLVNMDNLREACKKNMKTIDAAMEYQKKRNGGNRELFAKYQQEASSLKASMGDLINTIDVVYGDVQKSYDIVNTLDLEIPKADGLRQVAKELVEKGL